MNWIKASIEWMIAIVKSIEKGLKIFLIDPLIMIRIDDKTSEKSVDSVLPLDLRRDTIWSW